MLSMLSRLPAPVITLSLARLACACASTVPPMMFFILTEVFALNVSDTAIAMGSATTFLVLGNFVGGKICSRLSWWHTFIISQTLFLISLFSATLNNNFIGFIICIYLSCLFAGIFLVCFTLGTLSLAGTGDKTTALSIGYMFFNMGYAIGVASAGILFQFSYKWVFYFDCLANLIALSIFIIFVRPPQMAVGYAVPRKVPHRTTNSRIKLYLFLMLLVQGGFAFLLPLGLKQSASTVAPATQFGWLIAFSALATMILSPYILRATRNREISSNLKIASILYIASYFFLNFSGLSASLSVVSVLLWGSAGMLLLTYGEVVLQRSVPEHLSGAAAAAFQSLIQMGAVAGPLLAGSLVGKFSFLAACAVFCGLASLSAIISSKTSDHFK
ncbi:MFS transporter [Pseudomonas orientalis]|uniref:MFS transporter n=1 Tax=Pseudomonas orientalis TaxID=76758 RepID=UPI000F046DF8